MKKKTSRSPRPAPRARRDPDMRAEYDFSHGVRNKYAARFAKGTNLVLLEPDVAAAFPTGAAVNRALRAILEVAPTRRSKRSTA